MSGQGVLFPGRQGKGSGQCFSVRNSFLEEVALQVIGGDFTGGAGCGRGLWKGAWKDRTQADVTRDCEAG